MKEQNEKWMQNVVSEMEGLKETHKQQSQTIEELNT